MIAPSEWAMLGDSEREALVADLLTTPDDGRLTALLAAAHGPPGDAEVGRRAILMDLLQRGDMALHAALTATWEPEVTAAVKQDPTARLLATLVEMRHHTTSARRAALLDGLILDLDATWIRPPELRGVRFDGPDF